MKARAPGKVVVAGAYAVLEGARAMVAAVDRFVLADSMRPGHLLTDEVRAAGLAQPRWFDASELREGDRKLGLGSSAAILVATVAAVHLEQNPLLDSAELAERVYPAALRAHRLAQGGGSGIDVAAACFGGVLEFHRDGEDTKHSPLSPEPPLHIEIWISEKAASTHEMLARMRDYARCQPGDYRRLIAAQADASGATLLGWRHRDPDALIAGCAAQLEALRALGSASGVPIVTAEVAALAKLAARRSAVVLPAGAGGGDIALYVGHLPADFLRQDAKRLGHAAIKAQLGAPGVHAVNDTPGAMAK